MAMGDRSILALFSDVVDETVRLFQTEIRLVRAEITDKVGRIATSGVALCIGGVSILAAFIMLLMGAVRWLAIAGVPDQWGYLIVAVLIGGIGTGVLMKGVRDLRTASLVPQRTIEQIKADFATVKEHVT